MIKRCNCDSSYQDKKYGKKLRVHNKCKDKTKCRCTVCKQVKSV